MFASATGATTNPDAKSASVAGPTPAAASAPAGRPFYAPQGVRGPLKVSANGRYFVYADGTPFFYLGDTAWELFHRLDRGEADTYLQDRANKGFNVIQAVVLAEQDGLRVPNPYGDVPFQNLDPTRPNEAYFQHVDYIVNKAASLGMYTGMLPTWGDKWNNWWGIGPMIFNQSNARTYGAWLANRYKSKPIIWILGGDRVPTRPEHYGVIRAMAEGIRSVVGDSQLITFHPEGKKTSATFFHGDRWMDFNTYQSGHYAYNFDDAYQLAAENYRRSPAKPSFNIEPLYEDHPVNWQPATGWFNDYDVRQAAYWSVFSGGAGHTYGNHNIWQFYDPNGGYKRIGNARTPWRQALGHDGAGQMRHLRKLMEARKMLTLVPDQGVIAGGQGGGADYMAAARGEDFAFVYVSTGQNVTVNLGKVSGNEVRGWWYDPRTGRATHIGKFNSDGTRAFDAPGSKGRGNDWVLILDDAAKNYAAPDGTRPPQDEPANQQPVVSISQPANNAAFTAGADVTLQANASDKDGSVRKVEFYNGNTKLGEATSAPWSFAWKDVKEGQYTITAKATDNDGATATTGTVNISVNAPAPAPNRKPVVALTAPSNNASYTAGADIAIAGNASDEDGSVRKVEFFAGDNKLGETTSAPWSFAWKDVEAGNYTLTAKATDNDGATTTSAGVTVTVKAPAPPPNKRPVVSLTSPDDDVTFTAGATVALEANATDEDGSVRKVEFYNGDTKLGEATSAPWQFSWEDVKAGRYTVTARATDNDRATATSAAVTIRVNAPAPVPVPNKKPVVAMTAPANNASYTAGADIAITSSASDEDGRVSKVEFFAGDNKLGETTSAPWSFAWKDVKEGSYTLTAKATDNDGATATAAAVAVTVKARTPDPEPEPQPVPPVADGDFYRAINLNGTALKIDNNNWQGSNASNYTYNATPYTELNVGLKPATDANRTTMLRTFIFSRNLKLTLSAVPDGKYDVYLYVWEDGQSETFDVRVEGKTVKNDHQSGSAGTWSKLGPYAVNVADNTIDVDLEGGFANLSGIEVWKSKANAPTPTEPAEPEPTPPVASCSATGTILEEVWTNVPGIAVNNIPLNRKPDATNQLTLFEAPAQAGDNYGRRIRGYVCPPTTGDYTFFIASDDHSELWLSTDDSPANKVKIAGVTGWARRGEWDKYSSQRSEPVALQAGKKYYIEALQKDEAGADNLAVGWELPGGTLERPIPGERLSGFVEKTPDVASCEDTGGLLREFWADAPGCDIGSIPLHRPATSSSIITSFEGPINVAHDYGARIRGYICPPATGDYTFWLASDDAGELWISTDENPANKTRIAFVRGWTNPREWEKYPTQKSGTVYLETGRRYYVEVLHKDCENGDYMGVGWQLPDGELERPIAGNRLIPFRSAASEELDNLQRAEVYPNPASQEATLKFYSREDHDAEIVVTNSLALHVLTLKKPAKAGRNEVKLEFGNLPRGVYYINIDNQYAEKLIIAR